MTIPYIFIIIIALGIIFAIVTWKNRKKLKPISALGALSFGLVVAGIVFGSDNRVFAYSLIGLGIILAVVDIAIKSKK